MSWQHPDPKAPRPPGPAPLVGVRWRPFRLPLRAPVATAAGTIEERHGVIVELRDAEDRRGFGEASPLLANGPGAAAEVLRLLDEWGPRVLASEDQLALPHSVPAAALRCAVDCARLDLEGERRGLRIAAILGGGAVREVRVNAVIGTGSPEQAQEQAAAAVAAGYGTIKLKVAAAPLAEDRQRVEAVREAAPGRAPAPRRQRGLGRGERREGNQEPRAPRDRVRRAAAARGRPRGPGPSARRGRLPHRRRRVGGRRRGRGACPRRGRRRCAGAQADALRRDPLRPQRCP